MIQTPILVQEAPIVRMSNSVLVGTMKFTLDQCDAFFTAQNAAPARLAAQLADYRASYDNLNAAYALTRESLITIDIKGLDTEGDQLFIGSKETVEGARRMAAVPARKQAGDRLWVFIKKYGVDTKDNYISEWSKLQQLTEEANNSAQLTADLATLGLTEMWARLTEIAQMLRDKLTERSDELPSQQAMKQAREAIYKEYRLLIQLINAYALVDSDTRKFYALISKLNNNIDYVRVHAMTNGGSTQGNGGSGSGSTDGGTTTDPSTEGGSTGTETGGGTSTGGSSSEGGSTDPGTGGGTHFGDEG